MKIVEEPKRPKIPDVRMQFDPFIIYLTTTTRLEIEKGDTILEVMEALLEHWPIKRKLAASLATYFFAMGERLRDRRMSDKWRKRELMVSIHRQYLFD